MNEHDKEKYSLVDSGKLTATPR